jgi:hypothetical protein
MALGALVVAVTHVVVDVRSARRAERSDVRVEARHEPVAVGSGSYVLTVVVTNHGPITEHVERIGLWFEDTRCVFGPTPAARELPLDL